MYSAVKRVFRGKRSIPITVTSKVKTVDHDEGTVQADITVYTGKAIPLSISSEDRQNPNVKFSDSSFMVMVDKDMSLTDVITCDGEEMTVIFAKKINRNPKVFSVIARGK